MCLEMQEGTKAGKTTRTTVWELILTKKWTVKSSSQDERGPSDDRKQVKKPQHKWFDKYLHRWEEGWVFVSQKDQTKGSLIIQNPQNLPLNAPECANIEIFKCFQFGRWRTVFLSSDRLTSEFLKKNTSFGDLCGFYVINFLLFCQFHL